MQRDNDFRILQFIHRAQGTAAKMRAPVALVACGLIYALILEILDAMVSALSERKDANVIKMVRGELRGIRRRADGKTREEEGE